ncbi:unnamed protein product [Diatraea saccharalis]|uniref:Atrial natriuretic peptide-converting enzyme n=1 Tax=Diatraea saccharalis TaxID=40085 RepID=A0A9N9QUN1_9NEOP|nr:unnamed protein product [Diatraea saccharalis]
MTFSGNMKENKPRTVKDTWESELGYGWSHSGRRCARHRPPESTMSVSSDIRFTRRKLSRPCRGCCAALASLLVLLLLAAVAVYLAHLYLFGDPLNRQTFRGSFVVASWPQNEAIQGNITREAVLQQSFLNLYQNTELRSCFVAAEILALDSVEKGERVHFEVSFEPIFTAVATSEVASILEHELSSPRFFNNINIFPETLHIEESSMISSLESDDSETTLEDAATTEAITLEVEEFSKCYPRTLSLCSYLPYNSTTYPNLVGHTSKDAILKDLVAFRELLDAECSHLAQDFVCQMLQPRCEQGRLVKPCRAYCHAFHAGCGARLPDRLKPLFNCSLHFPEYFGPGSCMPEPDCHGGLNRLALSRRSCDGVPDCASAEDERSCTHCAAAGAGALRCALDTRCLPQHLRCDGTPDCPDGSDETGCLWISRSLAWWRRERGETTLGAVRSRAGYAVWSERGRDGKICATPFDNDKRALKSVATSLCRAMSFKVATNVEVTQDLEELGDETPEYVEVVDPFAPEISFLKSECPERKIIKIVCDQLECGVPSARGVSARSGVEGLPRAARPGDWPWHAALLRAGVHACDAALLHPGWLITTASCFQGQPNIEWTARFGTVRIQSTTPWQQEQRVVEIINSPVEGSMLSLVRLEKPVEMTDFVRPVCLPENSTSSDDMVCNTLSWTRNRDQLQRVHVVINPMKTCENVSIATVNGICSERLYDKDDCDEEEYAGSSMMCFDQKTKHWLLVGVSGWRIACTKIGLGRPRIYDAISSQIDWIKQTILNNPR